MMYRIVILGFCVLLAAPAMAQTAQDRIVQQLQSQGYSDITVQRTLLGRVRVLALGDENRREIVFNPNTGEILRDYWANLPDARDASRSDRAGRNGDRRRIINSSDDDNRDDKDDRDDTDDRDDRDDTDDDNHGDDHGDDHDNNDE